MAVIIQLRRGMAEEWANVNPVLAKGEVGVELDTNLFKIGNGTQAWGDLSYFTGAEGPAGADGSTWHASAGAPEAGLGEDADYYLDTTDGEVYRKEDGSWNSIGNLTGPTGSEGAPGADGATWHSGAGSPGSEAGSDGDYYLDTTDGAVYRKDSGSWGSIGNLTGPAGSDGSPGVDGSTWYTDAGAPGAELGINGDYFLNITDGEVYWKDDGAWASIGNLTGPAGSDGSPGTDGATWHSGTGSPAGELGTDSDYYLNTADGEVYHKLGGTWTSIGNLTGPAGSDGSPGVDGTHWYTGEGVPDVAMGEDGDLCLDQEDGTVYVKDAGVWDAFTNLTGPQGEPGEPFGNIDGGEPGTIFTSLTIDGGVEV